MPGDLAHQIAARNVFGAIASEAPAGDEEDRLDTAAIELIEDQRRPAQVGPVIEREQQLARVRRRARGQVGSRFGGLGQRYPQAPPAASSIAEEARSAGRRERRRRGERGIATAAQGRNRRATPAAAIG